VIDANGLFPSDMMAPHLAGEGDGVWLVAGQGGAAAVLCCAPERMTDGTWNNLLLAVHPDRHGQGVGRSLLAEVERRLAARGARLLLVGTSGLDGLARRFYAHVGCEEEARIRDFHAASEDKVVFRKAL
jgi:ribosomal protein S18 acetylase RimI-like enzyme